MSRIDPVRSPTGFHTASTFMPIVTSSGLISPSMCRNPPSEPSIEITAGSSGSSSGCMSQRTLQIENVCTTPVFSTCTQASVPRKSRSQNIRGGTSTRWQTRHSRPRIFPSRSPSRNRPIATPASHAYFAPISSSTAPVAERNSASESDCRRRRGRRGLELGRRGRRAALAAHHDDRADLHQVAPGLRDAAFGRPGHLARAGLAAELPEELGDLHQAGRRDRVADAEQAAARARGQVALAVEDAVAGRLGRLALVEQQEPLEVVQLLVVERVVGLGDVDLLARLGHAGHPVGHAGGVRDVLGEHEVAVGPVRRVEVPPDALDPDRVAR